MTDQLLMSLYIFALAGFVGHYVIESVPPLLHTPLMAGTNAISGISLVGSLVVAGSEYSTLATDPRHHRRDVRQHQHGRRLPDHRPHAEDVQEQREAEAGSQEVMSSLAELLVPGRVALLHPDAAAARLAQDGAPRRVARRDRHDGGGARHRAAAQRHRHAISWIALGFIARLAHRHGDVVHPDDQDAGANRALALLRRSGGGARRHRRVPASPRTRAISTASPRARSASRCTSA